jgi:hypothetical protein
VIPRCTRHGAEHPDRYLIARLAAHESWANTADPSARTAPACRALLDRFERQVDRDGALTPAVRTRRAGHARPAYSARLALRSAQARRKSAAVGDVIDPTSSPVSTRRRSSDATYTTSARARGPASPPPRVQMIAWSTWRRSERGYREQWSWCPVQWLLAWGATDARTRPILISLGWRATCGHAALNSAFGSRSARMPGEPMRVHPSRARSNRPED